MASFGEKLRREREMRGVSLRDVAETTKISMRFLQALEQDRLELLPGGIFRRAFIRQYARCLGLDGERLLAELEYVHGTPAAPEPAVHAPRQAPPWRVPLLVGGGVVLTFLGWAALRRPATQEVSRPAVPLPSTLTPDRVFPPPTTPPPDAGAEAGLVLTLRASQSCWVAARADGQPVLDRVLGAGESETLRAESEILLSVGNAGGLSFSINDRPGLPLGRSGEVRRNIVINLENLPRLLQDAPKPDSLSG